MDRGAPWRGLFFEFLLWKYLVMFGILRFFRNLLSDNSKSSGDRGTKVFRLNWFSCLNTRKYVTFWSSKIIKSEGMSGDHQKFFVAITQGTSILGLYECCVLNYIQVEHIHYWMKLHPRELWCPSRGLLLPYLGSKFPCSQWWLCFSCRSFNGQYSHNLKN